MVGEILSTTLQSRVRRRLQIVDLGITVRGTQDGIASEDSYHPDTTAGRVAGSSAGKRITEPLDRLSPETRLRPREGEAGSELQRLAGLRL